MHSSKSEKKLKSRACADRMNEEELLICFSKVPRSWYACGTFFFSRTTPKWTGFVGRTQCQTRPLSCGLYAEGAHTQKQC